MENAITQQTTELTHKKGEQNLEVVVVHSTWKMGGFNGRKQTPQSRASASSTDDDGAMAKPDEATSDPPPLRGADRFRFGSRPPTGILRSGDRRSSPGPLPRCDLCGSPSPPIYRAAGLHSHIDLHASPSGEREPRRQLWPILELHAHTWLGLGLSFQVQERLCWTIFFLFYNGLLILRRIRSSSSGNKGFRKEGIWVPVLSRVHDNIRDS
jgi:hypothetical protein